MLDSGGFLDEFILVMFWGRRMLLMLSEPSLSSGAVGSVVHSPSTTNWYKRDVSFSIEGIKAEDFA